MKITENSLSPEGLRPAISDLSPASAKRKVEQVTKMFERDGIQPRTSRAEQLMHERPDLTKSGNAQLDSNFSPRSGTESSVDRLTVLETSIDHDQAETSKEKSMEDARQILAEWESEFSDDLDREALQTALTKYDSYTIEGLVSTASDYPSEMRTLWLNDRVDQLNKTADIPGMTELADKLTDDFAVPTQQGTEFELDWIAAHTDQVQSVGLETADRIKSDGRVHGLKQGVDVLLKDGTAVELKCYDFSRPSYQKGAGVEGPLRQLERDISRQGFSRVKLVFDTSFGNMPEAFRRRLDAGIVDLRARHPGTAIDCETWRRTR